MGCWKTELKIGRIERSQGLWIIKILRRKTWYALRKFLRVLHLNAIFPTQLNHFHIFRSIWILKSMFYNNVKWIIAFFIINILVMIRKYEIGIRCSILICIIQCNVNGSFRRNLMGILNHTLEVKTPCIFNYSRYHPISSR